MHNEGDGCGVGVVGTGGTDENYDDDGDEM